MYLDLHVRKIDKITFNGGRHCRLLLRWCVRATPLFLVHGNRCRNSSGTKSWGFASSLWPGADGQDPDPVFLPRPLLFLNKIEWSCSHTPTEGRRICCDVQTTFRQRNPRVCDSNTVTQQHISILLQQSPVIPGRPSHPLFPCFFAPTASQLKAVPLF